MVPSPADLATGVDNEALKASFEQILASPPGSPEEEVEHFEQAHQLLQEALDSARTIRASSTSHL